jgi:hypothetical protein
MLSESMSFPSTLSPSPVHEAFSGIQWDPLEKLQLLASEIALLRAAEDNVISYTLAQQDEAREYTNILLKVLDEVVVPRSKNSKVARLALEESLPDDEALQLLYVDYSGVIAHYAVTKLCEVVLCLKESSKKSKVTLLSTFYQPDGTLIENWRPLLRILLNGGSDAFAQSESFAFLFGRWNTISNVNICLISQPYHILPQGERPFVSPAFC